MMSWGKGFIAVVAACWRFIKTGWDTALPSRFSALMVLAGAVLLLFTDQGRDIIVGFSDKDHGQRLTVFLFCVAWLAFQSWYWARVALELNQGSDRSNWNVFTEWLPRLYGAICYVLAIWAFWRVDERYQAIIVAVSGCLFVTFIMHRYHLGRRLMAHLEKRSVTRGMTRALTAKQDTGKQGFRQVVDFAPIRKIALLGSIAFSIVTLALIVWKPVAVGQWLGPAAIAFLAFGHIVPVGSAAVIISTEARVPIVSLTFVFAFLLSGFFNNHVVATIPGTEAAVANRPLVQDAADKWLKTVGVEADTGKAIPIVFVSTAGGGLRAAYWTSTVLGALRDSCGAFVPHLFSISSVSGGTVGTAFFVASAKSKLTAPADAACSPDLPKADGSANSAERLMLKAESSDFLGPTVAALLYPDFVYRLLPLPFLKDRGQALADAWSDSWKSLCQDDDCQTKLDGDFFDRPFLQSAALSSSNGWSPVLLFNGTHQETGKRILASNVRITDSVFSDALDLQSLIDGDVNMKTAVLNSARFTYVSPAGELIRHANGSTIDEGHVLDGGYFENYGATTSSQAAQAALRELDGSGVSVMPIFIQISSDPDLADEDDPMMQTCADPSGGNQIHATNGRKAPSGEGRLWANEILAPIRGLMNTREARGILAMKSLACLAAGLHEGNDSYKHISKAIFVHFRMCAQPGQPSPPLGWIMSAEARDRIERQLSKGCDGRNAEAFAMVMDALRE